MFEGPFCVTEKVNDVVYKVRHLLSGKTLSVHTDRVKPEDCFSAKENNNVRRSYPVHETADTHNVCEPADVETVEKCDPATPGDGGPLTSDIPTQMICVPIILLFNFLCIV